jgi:hypothetical protein
MADKGLEDVPEGECLLPSRRIRKRQRDVRASSVCPRKKLRAQC